MSEKLIFDLRFDSKKGVFLLQPLAPGEDFGFLILDEVFEVSVDNFIKNGIKWASTGNGAHVANRLRNDKEVLGFSRLAKPLRTQGGVVGFGLLADGKIRVMPIHKGKRGEYGEVSEAVNVNPSASAATFKRQLIRAFNRVGVTLGVQASDQ